jgi:hypothetical protein
MMTWCPADRLYRPAASRLVVSIPQFNPNDLACIATLNHLQLSAFCLAECKGDLL